MSADPGRVDNSADRPDPTLLVERDPRESTTATTGWYLDPTSNGTRERYWKGTGYGWGTTRGSGPLRRWFRGLTTKQQQRLFAVVFYGGILLLAYLTRDVEFAECQYGGGRFDYTC